MEHRKIYQIDTVEKVLVSERQARAVHIDLLLRVNRAENAADTMSMVEGEGNEAAQVEVRSVVIQGCTVGLVNWFWQSYRAAGMDDP